MYIVRYSEIDSVLTTAVRQLRSGDSDKALKTLEGFMQNKPIDGLAIRSIIGRTDVKNMAAPSLMVNSCSMARLEEFAERMDNTALEMDELAEETFDQIDCPSDFMKEYPDKLQVRMDERLEELLREWMDELETDSEGCIMEDFLYWEKGTPLNEVEEFVESMS